MEQIISFWPLQEVFVDPEFPVKEEGKNLNLNLKTVVDHRKDEGIVEIIVEIFGSVTLKDEQVANIRFVNITKVKPEGKKIKTIKKNILKSKINELISFLPMYLSKSNLIVESINCEL